MASSVTAEQIIINIGNQMGAFYTLAEYASYLMGIWVISRAFMKIKKAVENHTGMYYQTEMFPLMMSFVLGVCLIWMPKFFDIVTETIFGQSTSILSQSDSLVEGYLDQAVWNALLQILAVIGVVAFIRGILVLKSATEGHGASQGGGVGKALTHMVGGILCYHIEAFFRVLKDTLGISTIF